MSEAVAVEAVEATSTNVSSETGGSLPTISVKDEEVPAGALVTEKQNDGSKNLECSNENEERSRIEEAEEKREEEERSQVIQLNEKAVDQSSSQTNASDESAEESEGDSYSDDEEHSSEGLTSDDDDDDDDEDDDDDDGDDSDEGNNSSVTLSDSVSEQESEDEVEQSQEEEVKKRESGDGQEAEKSVDNGDNKDPSFVPRHDRFWGHDDRTDDLPEIERRPQPSRKLWERTSDKWLHDMYNEEEQGPKTQEEIEYSRREQTRRTGRRGRRYYDLKEFVTDDRRGEGRRRRNWEDGDRNGENYIESSRRTNFENEEAREPRRRNNAAFRGERMRRNSFEEGRETRSTIQRETDENGNREVERRSSRRQQNRTKNEDEDYSGRRRRGFGRRENREDERKRFEDVDWERNRNNRRRVQEHVSDEYLTTRRRERTEQWAEDNERGNQSRRLNQDRGNGDSQRRWERDQEVGGKRNRRFERNRDNEDQYDGQERSRSRQRGGRQDEESPVHRGGFGPNQKEVRKEKDPIQNKTEKVVPSDTKHAASHSWSKSRGRGRGRSQDFQQPRKRAEDFTRERELARKTESEMQRKKQNQKNFEDAVEEDADVIVEESEEEYENNELQEPAAGESRTAQETVEQLSQEGASASISNDRNAIASAAEPSQDRETSQISQKGSTSSTTASAKPKRYSSQRQRVTQQMPAAISNEPTQEQIPPVVPEGYYEQMVAGYQGMYAASGTPPTQPHMPMLPQEQGGVLVQSEMQVPQGEHVEVPSGMHVQSMGQPMAPLQHEAMVQQRLAMAYQHGMLQQERAMATASSMSQQGMQQMQPQQAVAQQERPVAPSNMMQPQNISQLPAQQQSQGVQPGQVLSPMSQGNMMMAGAPHVSSSVGFMPNMQQQILYGNPPFPLINMGLPGQMLPPQMYSIPMQSGAYFPPPNGMQNSESADAAHLRRRPTAAIPIRPPPD